MKKIFLLIIVAFFAMNAFSQNNDAEIENIKKTILTAYVDGLQNEGDIEKIDKGFHPDFELLGIGKENKIAKQDQIGCTVGGEMRIVKKFWELGKGLCL